MGPRGICTLLPASGLGTGSCQGCILGFILEINPCQEYVLGAMPFKDIPQGTIQVHVAYLSVQGHVRVLISLAI